MDLFYFVSPSYSIDMRFADYLDVIEASKISKDIFEISFYSYGNFLFYLIEAFDNSI